MAQQTPRLPRCRLGSRPDASNGGAEHGHEAAQPAAFTGSRYRFETVLVWLEGEQAAALSHGELEERLQVEARELFRQVL